MKYPVRAAEDRIRPCAGNGHRAAGAPRWGGAAEWMERRHYSNDLWDQAVMIGWDGAERESGAG